MKKRLLAGLIVVSVLAACSPKMTEVWTKYDYTGKEYKKILVVATTKNNGEEGRAFEDAIVRKLNKKGINATNSFNIIPSEIPQDGLDEEQIQLKVQEGNYDGILVSWLVDVKTMEVNLIPNGYYSEVGSYRSYINKGYRFEYAPNNTRREKSYVLETKLFDAHISSAKESVIWSGQYSITNPESFYHGVSDYATLLVNTLTQTGILVVKK